MAKTSYIQRQINKQIASWYGCQSLEELAQRLKAKSAQAEKDTIKE